MVPWVDIILVFERDRDREFACVSFKDVVRSGLRVHQWYPSTCKTTANKQTFGSVDSDPHPGSWETTQENRLYRTSNPGLVSHLGFSNPPEAKTGGKWARGHHVAMSTAGRDGVRQQHSDPARSRDNIPDCSPHPETDTISCIIHHLRLLLLLPCSRSMLLFSQTWG